MAARSVPLWEELWCKRDIHVEVLSDASENVSRHPQVVSDADSLAWSNLVFPLSWHDLCVCSRNIDSSIEASLVMNIRDDAAEAVVGSDRAVVWSLGSWVSICWPSERPSSELSARSDKRELLLNSVPGLFILDSVPNLLGEMSEVSVIWDELLELFILPLVAFAEHENVVTLSERIAVHGDWLEDDFRLFSQCLVCGRTIIIPFWKLRDVLNWAWESAALSAHGDSGTVNPDVLSDNLATLVDAMSDVVLVEE